MLCSEEDFTTSDACDVLAPENMVYYQVRKLTLELEPRSSCGFYLYEYSAFADIYAQYPITVYARDFKTVTYSDIDYMTVKGAETSKTPGVDCFKNECNTYVYVTYGRWYVYITNWSHTTKASLTMEVVDLGSTYFSQKSIALLVATTLGLYSVGSY